MNTRSPLSHSFWSSFSKVPCRSAPAVMSLSLLAAPHSWCIEQTAGISLEVGRKSYPNCATMVSTSAHFSRQFCLLTGGLSESLVWLSCALNTNKIGDGSGDKISYSRRQYYQVSASIILSKKEPYYAIIAGFTSIHLLIFLPNKAVFQLYIY